MYESGESANLVSGSKHFDNSLLNLLGLQSVDNRVKQGWYKRCLRTECEHKEQH